MDIPRNWLERAKDFSSVLGSPENYIIEQSTPSKDDLLLPSLSNGYVATDLTNPWVFVDGVFCGEGVNSHRGSIPSPVYWLPSVDGAECLQKYTLFHFGMGVCLEVQKFEGVDLYTSTFISRARPHIMVRSVQAVFLSEDVEKIIFKPSRKVDWETPDFDVACEESDGLVKAAFEVYDMEDPELNPTRDRVYLVSEVVSQLNYQGVCLKRQKPSVNFITSVSRTSLAEATKAFDSAFDVYRTSPDGLFTENADAWLATWRQGCITLQLETPCPRSSTTDKDDDDSWEVIYAGGGSGDNSMLTSLRLPPSSCVETRSAFSLARCLIAAQYALLASFPETVPDSLAVAQGADATETEPIQCGFFGVSPAGLAWGNSAEDYMGHVFWDMDIWILPWVSLLHPRLSKLAFDYRFATLRNAELRNEREGLHGARFPWESARTGLETSPWDLSANNEIHIVADVSIALQQWLIASSSPSLALSGADMDPTAEETGGVAWYNERGRQILDSIARYWASRVDFCDEKNAYVIRDVMPPDEYKSCCDNSAFTNAAASLALAGPARMARLFGREVDSSQATWEDISKLVWMPFDENEGVMLEYEGYVDGTVVKQADAILLSYPLMYPQTKEAKRNMISKYARMTSMSGPAMTWAMFCIAALELGLNEEAKDYFKRSILYCQMPFYVWTEERDRHGAHNFLTGLGGFLQAIMNGFAGIRVCTPSSWLSDGQPIPALFIRPTIAVPTLATATSQQPPETAGILNLRGISFLGRCINVAIDFEASIIKFTLVSGASIVLVSAKEEDMGHIPSSKCWKLTDVENSLALPFAAYWIIE